MYVHICSYKNFKKQRLQLCKHFTAIKHYTNNSVNCDADPMLFLTWIALKPDDDDDDDGD